MGDSGDEEDKAPAMSLGEMLLADGAGSAADWVNRSKKMEVIRAARQEREARRAPGAVQQSCAQLPHAQNAPTRTNTQAHWSV
jgi:hypothetical protein